MDLSEHMKETADLIAGYITGRLFVDADTIGMQLNSGVELILTDKHGIEILNGSEYIQITIKQMREARTVEGWPLFGGLYARVRGGDIHTINYRGVTSPLFTFW
ncbi:hypothetical protein [Paenibacillus sp. GCM10012303]|uniref:hypothetical protein n=1 Tax=Paenibacillus sp. GCM10012303 TaxID=3317340 RepID=UPI003609583A